MNKKKTKDEGADLRIKLGLTIQEITTGVEKTIKIKRLVTAPGAVSIGLQYEIIKFNIPPGTKVGKVFRLKGKGNDSLDGIPGDMLILIEEVVEEEENKKEEVFDNLPTSTVKSIDNLDYENQSIGNKIDSFFDSIKDIVNKIFESKKKYEEADEEKTISKPSGFSVINITLICLVIFNSIVEILLADQASYDRGAPGSVQVNIFGVIITWFITRFIMKEILKSYPNLSYQVFVTIGVWCGVIIAKGLLISFILLVLPI